MDDAHCLIDGQPGVALPATDRGLTYGDGLFESVRFVGVRAPLWARHMQRLLEGCAHLRLPAPDTAQLHAEALAVSDGMAHAVVRITLTRGRGERGYAPPRAPQTTRIVAAFDAPPMAALARRGIRTRVCALRLAEQPLLAGIKHLNRLEQVLARAEWDDLAIAEGILRDAQNRVICATAANLVAVIGGTPITPALDRCGVAGVARAEVLAAHPAIRVGDLPLDTLAAAEEIFLTSSVRGIVPVQAVDERIYPVGELTRYLQRHWHDLGFPMEQPE